MGVPEKKDRFLAWKSDPQVVAVVPEGAYSVYFAMKIGLPFVEQALSNFSLSPWEYESGLDAIVRNAWRKARSRGFASVDDMLEDITPEWAEELL